VIELFEAELTRQLQAAVMGQGFEPADFTLLGYGGGGPLHVAGFSSELNFANVLVPTWAAAFSAFGCVCAPYSYRFDRQVDATVPLDGGDEQAAFIETVNGAWRELRERILAEYRKSGFSDSQVELQPAVRMQYIGQLNDIEVPLPMHELRGPDDIAAMIAEFERLYGNIYAHAAKSPELGYSVTLAILAGTVPIERPTLPAETEVVDPDPSAARKGVRPMYTRDGWQDATLYEMDELRAGMRVIGPATIEAPSTTFVVPSGRTAYLDQHRIFNLGRAI
jgi:N-methylhydantoinase A/oxoprolinase/acetone carboxylase beta subunit